jgi:thioredoxin-related protein
MTFYRQLKEQEDRSALRAHLLVVMPNNESTGGRVLSKGGLEAQAVFSQKLDALNVSGTPTVLLVDSNGHVERAWEGQLPPREENEVFKAAAE